MDNLLITGNILWVNFLIAQEDLRIKVKKNLKSFFVGLLILCQFLFPLIAQAGYDSWAQIVSGGAESTVIDIGNAAMKQGFNYESTIGLLANINSESGFDTSTIEAGNGIGRGLIQWSFERRTAMEKFIQEKYNGDFSSMEGQMAYLNYEITETSWKGEMNEATVNSQLSAYGLSISSKAPNSWDEFKQMTNAEDAAKIFMVVMERPSYAPSINHWEQRVRLAKEMAEALKGKLNGSSSSDNKGDEKSAKDIKDSGPGAPDEWELVGMTKRNYMYDKQNDVALPNNDGLTIAQGAAVASLKEDIHGRDRFALVNFLRTVVAFVGIWFFVWAIALIVAYLFDRSNVYFEFSLVSMLTFGSVTVLALEDGKERSESRSKVLKRVGLALIIGFILVSGSIYVGLSNVIYYIDKFLNGF